MKTREHIFVKQTGWSCSETGKQCFLSTNPRFTAESNIIISILWIWQFTAQSVYWPYLCSKLCGKLARRRSWGRRRGWSWYKWVWSDCNGLARCTTDLSDYEWWKLKALKRLRGLRDLKIPKKVPDCLFSFHNLSRCKKRVLSPRRLISSPDHRLAEIAPKCSEELVRKLVSQPNYLLLGSPWLDLCQWTSANVDLCKWTCVNYLLLGSPWLDYKLPLGHC